MLITVYSIEKLKENKKHQLVNIFDVLLPVLLHLLYGKFFFFLSMIMKQLFTSVFNIKSDQFDTVKLAADFKKKITYNPFVNCGKE